MSPFTSPLQKSFSEEQELVCTASSMPATPHAQIRPHSTPGGCVKSKVSWDHTRYPEKLLPGFSGWVFTSGHGLQGKALWPGGQQMPVCRTLQGGCSVVSASLSLEEARKLVLQLCLSLPVAGSILVSLSFSQRWSRQKAISHGLSSSHTGPDQATTVYSRSSGSQLSF